ncbi:unnamed protein product [Arabis nemorensis]|uniref:Replication factor A C-terminal domain-containing protein n=1 Tax=Arabis nemorensis TaxID=586526 RepID=A0A565CV04_9BRAS|nr:unnamed protein product [Arabis nemorensis]
MAGLTFPALDAAENLTNMEPPYAAPNAFLQQLQEYRVELAVTDGDHPATFVVFDKEMTKVTTKTAATLTLEAVSIYCTLHLDC